jgi:hypothetical protein
MSTLSQLNSLPRELCTVYSSFKLTSIMNYFQCTYICSCIRSQFPSTVHTEGKFWGANEHVNLSNGIGKDQTELLNFLIPHWHAHCIYVLS